MNNSNSPKQPQAEEPVSEWPIHELPRRRFSFLRVFLAVSLFVCIGTATLGYLWIDGIGVTHINKDVLNTVVHWKAPDNSIVFDRNGKKIGEFFTSYHVFKNFDEIPKSVVDAIVAIEDKNFWTHNGVDFQAIARAGLAFIKNRGEKSQGASTITQQVVRHFLLSNEKAFERKVKEIFLAIELEKVLSKQQIFEIYANAMFMGNRSYGLGAASLRYFGKPLADISPHEATLLAGLFQSPSKYDPTKNLKLAKKRQKQVILALVRNKKISKKEARDIYKTNIVLKEYQLLNQKFAPYFVDYVKEESAKILNKKSVKNHGFRIYTTLDSNLQSLADQTMKESEELLSNAEKLTKAIQDEQGRWHDRRVESSLLVTDPKNGEILAMKGGRDYETSQFNRTTSALRSPGSAFKPIVYSYALTKGHKWSDLLYVSPITVDGNYRPRGTETNYVTETTMLKALYKSMNEPTIELAKDLGINEVIAFARKIGIDTPIRDEFGSVLGSTETNLLSMAQVYSTFANGGYKNSLISIKKIEDRDGNLIYEAPELPKRQEKIFPPQISYLMTEGLKNVLKYGTAASEYELGKWAAGKTGTSNESKDNWFCGYTSELTAVVWTGTDDFSPMRDKAQGSSLALPIWAKFMKKAIAQKPPAPFEVPTDLTSLRINPNYGNLSRMGIEMWFLENNKPEENENSPLQALEQTQGQYRSIFTH